MNKRADAGLGAIVIIIIIVLFLGWLINEGYKECRGDSDCSDNQYCSSSFTCENFPVIQKTEYVSPQSNAWAWIIGICLIIAAVILKWDTLFTKKKKEGPHSHNTSDTTMYEEDLD